MSLIFEHGFVTMTWSLPFSDTRCKKCKMQCKKFSCLTLTFDLWCWPSIFNPILHVKYQGRRSSSSAVRVQTDRQMRPIILSLLLRHEIEDTVLLCDSVDGDNDWNDSDQERLLLRHSFQSMSLFISSLHLHLFFMTVNQSLKGYKCIYHSLIVC